MDSAGIGAMPDAAEFGDTGTNTLGHIIEQYSDIRLDNLFSLGLCKLLDIPCPKNIMGAFGKAAEVFGGKDTTGGHFEIAGLILDKPFPVFPNGFPESFIKEFEEAIGRKVIGNYAASGTVIIQDLGDKHVRTGYPIVYTSADSVFQIAMHEDVIPIETQYKICETARQMLSGDLAVGRVICRPFVGQHGAYTRTKNRRDFSFEPPGETILTALKNKGYEVAGVGKVEDIFANTGLTKSNHTTDNDAGISATIDYIKQDFGGLVLSNLVDFDSLYGHRNNAQGYKEALEALDARIPEMLDALDDDDVIMFTADHGCDPTTVSTDHSREYIPILIWGKTIQAGVDIGTRTTFADIAATVAAFFSIGDWPVGTSFYQQIMRGK